MFRKDLSPPSSALNINGTRNQLTSPLRSSRQRSWLQIQRSGFDSQRCQIFWEVVGVEHGPLSLVSTIKELLERKNGGSGPERGIMAVGIRHADHVAPSIRKMCL
jgi:hypothetical protein